MPRPLSYEHIKQAFSSVRKLMAQAIKDLSFQDLQSAINEFHKAKGLADAVQATWLLAEGLVEIRGAVNYKTILNNYRNKKVGPGFLELVLSAIPPHTGDVIGQDKSTIDTDERLIRSMLRHTGISEPFMLMRYLGQSSSRKAFALVLEDYLKQLSYAVATGEPHPNDSYNAKSTSGNDSAFRLLNAYKTPPRANEVLPGEIFDLMGRYPDALLMEHQHNKHTQQGGHLKLSILQGLMKRASSNERLLDVVEEIGSTSFFQLEHIEHAIWLENMGLKIHYEIAQRVLTSTTSTDHLQKAAFYYMLMSSNYPLGEIDRTIRMTAKLLESSEYVKALSLACQRHAEQPDLSPCFGNKVTVMIKAFLKRNERAAMAMLDLPNLPREALIKDERIREKLMLGDLGL